ncbi:Protein Jade [Seminavis robusta]|uniref:Protein Jade n=1 Tax=Seminavis robusta TaxID=568900 RepID=A0A9N8HH29_9STRA|nr:Protein Jade [Seminavis robusta]|eukprot:Sro677_g185870.1 Protein Jade (2554) ;mRNA; r:36926-44671
MVIPKSGSILRGPGKFCLEMEGDGDEANNRSGRKLPVGSSSSKAVSFPTTDNLPPAGNDSDTAFPTLQGELLDTPREFTIHSADLSTVNRRGIHQHDPRMFMNDIDSPVHSSPMFGTNSPPINGDELLLAGMAANHASPDAAAMSPPAVANQNPTPTNHAAEATITKESPTNLVALAVNSAAAEIANVNLASSSSSSDEESGDDSGEDTETECEDDVGKQPSEHSMSASKLFHNNETPRNEHPDKTQQEYMYTSSKVASVGTHAMEKQFEKSEVSPMFAFDIGNHHDDNSQDYVQTQLDNDDDAEAVAVPIDMDPEAEVVEDTNPDDDENNTQPSPKKKRGRPRKAASTGKKNKIEQQKQDPTVKKKRGRPKGSKNKKRPRNVSETTSTSEQDPVDCDKQDESGEIQDVPCIETTTQQPAKKKRGRKPKNSVTKRRGRPPKDKPGDDVKQAPKRRGRPRKKVVDVVPTYIGDDDDDGDTDDVSYVDGGTAPTGNVRKGVLKKGIKKRKKDPPQHTSEEVATMPYAKETDRAIVTTEKMRDEEDATTEAAETSLTEATFFESAALDQGMTPVDMTAKQKTPASTRRGRVTRSASSRKPAQCNFKSPNEEMLLEAAAKLKYPSESPSRTSRTSNQPLQDTSTHVSHSSGESQAGNASIQCNESNNDLPMSDSTQNGVLDDRPERIVNPLTDFTLAVSEEAASLPPDSADLALAMDIEFPKPDTFPIAYVARNLGFDMPLLDVDAEELPSIKEGSQFHRRRDDNIQSIPTLGTAFPTWEAQRYATGKNALGDDKDPLYNLLMNKNWNEQEEFPTDWIRIKEKDATHIASRCVEVFQQHGLLGADMDVKKVVPTKQSGRGKMWAFKDLKKDLTYRFWVESSQAESGTATGVFIEDHRRFKDKDYMIERSDRFYDTMLLVLTYAIMLDHARECKARYANLIVQKSMVDIITTLFRMEKVGHTKQQARMVCDLSKCSTKYAALVLQKKYREPPLQSPPKTERMFVALSSRPLDEVKSNCSVFTGAMNGARQAFVGLRVNLHGSTVHFTDAEGNEDRLVDTSDCSQDLSWNLLKSFRVRSQTVSAVETAQSSRPDEDEVLDLLRRKQKELADLENSLEPQCHCLLSKLVEERRAHEERKKERQERDREIMELYKRTLNRKDVAAAYKQLNDDMEAVCMVCNDGSVTHKNRIVFCDDCDLAVHQHCYGIDRVPEKKWFCSLCTAKRNGWRLPEEGLPSCSFCPCSGRKLGGYHHVATRTQDQKASTKWVHALCAKWQGIIPIRDKESGCSIYIAHSDFVAKYRREGTTCCLCRSDRGAFVRCKVFGCNNHVHVSCASQSQQCNMIHGERARGQAAMCDPWTLTCPEHSDIAAQGKGVSLNELIEQAQLYESRAQNAAFDRFGTPAKTRRRSTPKSHSFASLSSQKQKEMLCDSNGEQAFLQEMQSCLAGARCDVCDVDYGEELQRCLSCRALLCQYCTETSESNYLQTEGFRCGGCNFMAKQAKETKSPTNPQCSVCFQKHGWLRKAKADPMPNKLKTLKKKGFEGTLFAKELWCHTLCARMFLSLEKQDTKDGEVDLSLAILSNGKNFILPAKVCNLCGNSGGMKDPCNNNRCRQPGRGRRGPFYFHATCARQAGFTARPRDIQTYKNFELYCFRHSVTTNSLRAKIEDLLDTETSRVVDYGSEEPLTNAFASTILRASIEILRILGWSWAWEEWWVKWNYNWEPFIAEYKVREGKKEEDLTDEEKRIFHSTEESRLADAKQCSLASFGAALRNRNYDVPDGFDNESFERALRAVLKTPSVVGPLRNDLFNELEFLVEWLGRAYRSKSRDLGFGDHKIECGDASFLFESTRANKLPKFELGNRPLPGRIEPAARAVRRVQDTPADQPKVSLEKSPQVCNERLSSKMPSKDDPSIDVQQACSAMVQVSAVTSKKPESEKRTTKAAEGDACTPRPDDQFEAMPESCPKLASAEKASPSQCMENSEGTEIAESTEKAAGREAQPSPTEPSPTNIPRSSPSEPSELQQNMEHDDGATTETEATFQLDLGKKAVIFPVSNGGKQIPRRRPRTNDHDVSKSKARGLPVSKKKRTREETDEAPSAEKVAKRLAGGQDGTPSVYSNEHDGAKAAALEAPEDLNSSAKKRSLAQLECGEDPQIATKIEHGHTAGQQHNDDAEEEEVEESDQDDDSSDESEASVKTYNTCRSRKSYLQIATAKPKTTLAASLVAENSGKKLVGFASGAPSSQEANESGTPAMNPLSSERMATIASPAMRSMGSKRDKRPAQVQSPAAASRASLRPRKQKPMASFKPRMEDKPENTELKDVVKRGSVVADENHDETQAGLKHGVSFEFADDDDDEDEADQFKIGVPGNGVLSEETDNIGVKGAGVPAEEPENDEGELKLGMKGNSVIVNEHDEDEIYDEGATHTGRNIAGNSDAVSVLTACTHFPSTPNKGAFDQKNVDEQVKQAQEDGFDGSDVKPEHLAGSRGNHMPMVCRNFPRRSCLQCKEKNQHGCAECFLVAFERNYDVHVDRSDLPLYLRNKTIPICLKCFDEWHKEGMGMKAS